MSITSFIKRRKIISLFLMLILVGIGFCLGFFVLYAQTIIASRSDDKPFPFYNGGLAKEHLIAHAGGIIDGNIYTNSREAIEGSIKAGRKYIEIDLLETTDGAYIAGHDWELVNKMIGRSGEAPISLEDSHNAKLYGKYSMLDEKQIAELFEKYPDWIMLTDKTRDVDHLAKAFPYPDRMIVQVFSLKNYFKALKLGFKYPTLRLKGGRRGIKGIYKKFMEWGNVKSVILGELSFNKNKDYIGELHNKGVSVILYGNPFYKIVDNPEAIKQNLYKYIDLVDSDKLTTL